MPEIFATEPARITSAGGPSVWNKMGPKTMLNKSLKKVKAAIAQGRTPTMLHDDAGDSLDELTEQFNQELTLLEAKDVALGAAAGIRRTVSADISSASSASGSSRNSTTTTALSALQGAARSAAELLRPAPLAVRASLPTLRLGGSKGPASFLATTTTTTGSASADTLLTAVASARLLSAQRAAVAVDTTPSTPAVVAPIVEEDIADTRFSWDSFEKVRAIGSGSYGCVTLCRHKRTGLPCIVKQVSKAYAFAKHEQQHALNEKDILTKLTQSRCPFAAQVYGYFQDADYLYYVLEYVPGGELFTYMVQYDKFDDEEAKFFVAQLALALEHMHKSDIAYRDVKPENMLVDKDGYIKVCDFGFARVIPRGQRAYTMCGTPEYIAPEILRGKGHGVAPDIWSLGIFAYELLCGRTPFEGGSSRGTHVNILNGAVRFPTFVTPLARDFISKLLVQDENSRLGCGVGGFAAIFSHPWLASLDLEALKQRKLRSPIDVKVSSPFDSCNFDGVPADMQNKAAQLAPLSPDLDLFFADFDYVARQFPADAKLEEPVSQAWAVF